MSDNTGLRNAKRTRNDEFYTLYSDIEKEMKYYTEHFKGKVVYCNCDNPDESNFWRYFHLNFGVLGLKKLISTCYNNEFRKEYTGGCDDDVDAGEVYCMKSTGDFRSDECIEILKQSDIVCTNPPFSLFREYISQLFEYGKDFVILGNQNAITYKEVFPLIKDNKLWLGCRSLCKDMYFDVPEDRRKWLVENKKEGSAYKIINGVVMGRLASACWFTNIDHSKRYKWIETTYQYSKKDTLYPDLYPKYDNYNAIEVSKVSELPMDYDGVMGVPITFLDKYNPEQFEIVKFRKGDDDKDLCVNGKCPYFRILIRKKVDKTIPV